MSDYKGHYRSLSGEAPAEPNPGASADAFESSKVKTAFSAALECERCHALVNSLVENLCVNCRVSIRHRTLAIDALVSDATRTAETHGWTDHSIGESLVLIISEAIEALEDYREKHPIDEIRYGEEGKPEGFTVELADGIIRAFHLAGKHKLPLARAILEKMAYNETRPFRHGGKAL